MPEKPSVKGRIAKAAGSGAGIAWGGAVTGHPMVGLVLGAVVAIVQAAPVVIAVVTASRVVMSGEDIAVKERIVKMMLSLLDRL